MKPITCNFVKDPDEAEFHSGKDTAGARRWVAKRMSYYSTDSMRRAVETRIGIPWILAMYSEEVSRRENRQNRMRYTVNVSTIGGPDGATLYRVIDGDKSEPDDVVTYFSDHPRLSGDKARELAASLCVELNAEESPVAASAEMAVR